MSKNLVIVESPAKAKTIGKFLGRNYKVLASYGHVRDLPKSKLGVDVEGDFDPQYVIPTKTRKNLTALKEAYKDAEMVWLASDEDREGEAIAWHIKEGLKLSDKEIKRVAFHEITKEAIAESFKNPREIDMNMVDAQQARRVLDRLVGYKLSPLLWKKIFRGLSAGRVQSAALRLLVEREREIQAFKPDEYWEIELTLEGEKGKIATQVINEGSEKAEPKSQKDSDRIVKKINEAKEHKVGSVKKGERKRNPSPPFITSTLQQSAGTNLGFSVKKTMMMAQQLYEGINVGDGSTGLITYMRTDSTYMNAGAVANARDYIKTNFGKEYIPEKPIFYKTKSKGAQEAHEAIRPTNPSLAPETIEDKLSPNQFKVYKLIWQRMLASQMLPAILSTQEVLIQSGEVTSKANGASVAFEGFAKVFDKWPFKENLLPDLTEAEILKLLNVEPSQHFTEPPARYTEPSLVKQMEALGIGRPSTYAPTITTLGTRGYLIKEQKALVPQEVGMLVNDFLVEHFPNIVDYEFTAKMEESLDDVAEGTKEWKPMIKDFYGPFNKLIEMKEESVEKQTPEDEVTDKKCELCEKPMIIKTGRFGKFMACSGFPECRYTMQIAKDGEAISQKTDKKCEDCGSPMLLKNGRFGEFYGCSAYPKCKNIVNSEKSELDMDCPKCEGKVVSRRTKRGKVFYGCSKYPKCDFAAWDKPLKDPCPTCGKMMVEKGKQQIPTCVDCGFEDKSRTIVPDAPDSEK